MVWPSDQRGSNAWCMSLIQKYRNWNVIELFPQYTTQELGEPLNVIITAHSDPFILTEIGLHYYAKWVWLAPNETHNVFYFWLPRLPAGCSRSLGFSEECLGLHYGNIHTANLGDGDGPKDEQFLARQHYFPIWGSCWESVAGKFSSLSIVYQFRYIYTYLYSFGKILNKRVWKYPSQTDFCYFRKL